MRKHRQTLKSAGQPAVGETMRLGAKRTPEHILAKVPYIHAFLDTAASPLVPDQTLYSKGMHGPWGDLGNINYGNCIFAGYGHFKQSASSNSKGTPAIVTTEQALGWYTDVTGFDPNDPSTDNGAYAVEALDYFVRIGEIAAYGRVDVTKPDHMALASNVFGGLYTILWMPKAWQGKTVWSRGPNTSGIWAPGSWGGHCVFTPDYNSSMTLTGISWGDPVQITEDAEPDYMPECYAIVSNDLIEEDGDSIQGFRLDELKRQLLLVA